MISLHTHNDVLMCKAFPLSLIALRWFNGLRKGSIHSFAELIQEFSVRFMTCSRVPQPIDALLSMKIKVGEPFVTTQIGTGNFTMRSVGATRKSQQALLDWGCPRIPSYGSH